MDTPSPELVKQASAASRRQVVAIFSAISAASAWAAGALGVFVVQQWGGSLGQLGQMYASMETEPVLVTPSIPWPLVALLALVPVPVIATRRWGWLLPSALPFAALPWWLMYRAAIAAAPTT